MEATKEAKREAERKTEEELIVLIALIDSLEEALILNILGALLPISKGEVQNIRKYKNRCLGKFSADTQKSIKKVLEKVSIKGNSIFWKYNIENMKYLNKVYSFGDMKTAEAQEINMIINKYSKMVSSDINRLFGILTKSAYKELLNDMDGIQYVEDKNKYVMDILNKLMNKGLRIHERGGREERVQTSVKRLYKTMLNKCFGDVTLCRARHNNINHVLVSSHLGARHVENPNPEYLSHDIWQGKVYKLKGNEV